MIDKTEAIGWKVNTTRSPTVHNASNLVNNVKRVLSPYQPVRCRHDFSNTASSISKIFSSKFFKKQIWQSTARIHTDFITLVLRIEGDISSIWIIYSFSYFWIRCLSNVYKLRQMIMCNRHLSHRHLAVQTAPWIHWFFFGLVRKWQLQ